MTPTLESIKTAQERLEAMINEFVAQAARVAVIPTAAIPLGHGEHYAGLITDNEGRPSHHLVLLPGQAESVGWESAGAWAAEVGGELPSRNEQALLYANLKGKFEAAWYWSSEQHASSPSGAWVQYFGNGYQSHNHKSYEGRARAVRRVAI